ncbi:helix-turn-helix domain-containing protein [Marinobacter sp. 1_MG-2023]|uniref:AraC family transcriptional regulator n=1 Tax=Marinobacter sp. 1_MG-2023 TaxID=3062627 RepID=UPI0026E2ECDC|nr:helix-turn-helix domain-containing protein [Marinobacter sp. 1_MG-2023]MDO6824249.1 helix-turn-helix domain-containing protein [Marinobacter sp. 1_MG-2023]
MLILTGFSLGCLVILLITTTRELHRSSAARVFAVFLIASFGFLLHPLAPAHWQWLTLNLQGMLPALFWLLCQITFRQRLNSFSVWSLMALFSVVAPSVARCFYSHQNAEGWVLFLGWELGQLFEFVIIANGFWIVLADWPADLVEPRRKLRALVLVFAGTAVLWVALAFNLGIAHAINRALVVSIAGVAIATFLLQGRFSELSFQSGLTPPTKPEHNEEPNENTGQADFQNEHAKRLADLMAEGYYRTEHLTLKRLAGELDLPEYRTRALINKHLGYRNFNDYINQLRIAEASTRLITAPDTPILNIALDVGYRSLSSFNRAFREIKQATPTEFRQKHSAA